MVVVIGLEVLAKHFSGLDTGWREVRWLELHPGDGRDGRDDWRLRRKLVRGEESVGCVMVAGPGAASQEEDRHHVTPSSQSGGGCWCWRQYR